MRLQESGEMYLESIYVLTKNNPHVRAIDVGEYMGYSKPSVSRAMGLLKSGGYVSVDESGFITLLPPGREVAEKIYERHTLQEAEVMLLRYTPLCGIRHLNRTVAEGCDNEGVVTLRNIIDFIVTRTVGSTTDSRALDRYRSIGDMLACGEVYNMSEDC